MKRRNGTNAAEKTGLILALGFAGLAAGCGEPVPLLGTISGRVSVEGDGLPGATLTLDDGKTATTGQDGSYSFADVQEGMRLITLSGFPADVRFGISIQSVTLEPQLGNKTVDFTGVYLRTSSISGRVAAEGQGLEGVRVARSGPDSSTAVTDSEGRYSFALIRAGTHALAISNYDQNLYDFQDTVLSVTVAANEAGQLDFAGTLVRVSAIRGEVSVEGDGLDDVSVQLSGDEEKTTRTDARGRYLFDQLAVGRYSIEISGFEGALYEFDDTRGSVTLGKGDTAMVDFSGEMIRASSILGTIMGRGVGIPNIGVRASSPLARDSVRTDQSGKYSLDGLPAGRYEVSVYGYETGTYLFSAPRKTVVVEKRESKTVDFTATVLREGSIRGRLFLDAAPNNNVFDPEERPLPAPGHVIQLQGPFRTVSTQTNNSGAFRFDSLGPGRYDLILDNSIGRIPDTRRGYTADMFRGITLAGGESKTLDIPLDITHHTVTVQVVHGYDGPGGAIGPAAGMSVALYSRSTLRREDRIVSPVETDATGRARLRFNIDLEKTEDGAARSDGIVFVRGIDDPRGDFGFYEDTGSVAYDQKGLASSLGDPLNVLNRKVSVAIDTRTIKTKLGGGEEVNSRWKYWVGLKSTGQAPTNATSDFMATRSGSRTVIAGTRDARSLPEVYWIRLDPLETDIEMTPRPVFPGSEAEDLYLVYRHDGLRPAADTVDLGAMAVRYLRQSLVVGVHRELDDIAGYTDDDTREIGDARVYLTKRSATGGWQRVRDGSGKHVFAESETGVFSFSDLDAKVEYGAVVDPDDFDYIIAGDSAIGAAGAPDGRLDRGAFGLEGGFSNLVRRCPLTPASGSNVSASDCSTFSLKRTGGSVSGSVAIRGDHEELEEMDIVLDPVWAGEKTREAELSLADSTEFHFANLPDGSYDLSIASPDRDWQFETVTVDAGDDTVGFKHADRYSKRLSFKVGAEDADTVEVALVYADTEISGVVGIVGEDLCGSPPEINAACDSPLDDDASDIRVELRRSGVLIARDETNSRGRFSFDGLPAASYTLRTRPANRDFVTYWRYRIGRGSILKKDSTPKVDHSDTLAAVGRISTLESATVTETTTYPSFRFATNSSSSDDPNSGIQFLAFRLDGQAEGAVYRANADGTNKKEAGRVEVRAYLCQSYEEGEGCTHVDIGRSEGRGLHRATTNGDGEWTMTGLRTGYYVVVIDPDDLGDRIAKWEDGDNIEDVIDDEGDNRVFKLSFAVFGRRAEVDIPDILLVPST